MSSAAQFQHGDFIGGYLVKRKLGAGGMAEVFLVARPGPGATSAYAKHFALKLIRQDHVGSEEFAEHFEREMLIASQLEHPNIVSITNYGEHAGRRYLVMELVQGVDLGALTLELAHQARDPEGPRPTFEGQADRRLPPKIVALIGMQMADALAYAHADEVHDGIVSRKGVVHRDISPGNVMVDQHGYIKINDWGIARNTKTGQQVISATEHSIGKLTYMPPEQLEGKSLTPNADLYTTGVTLARLLIGHHPFLVESPDDTPLAMAVRAARGQRPRFVELAPTAPELCAILERLVEPDRQKRMQSADELIHVLTPLVGHARPLRKQLGALCKRVYQGNADTRYDPESQPSSSVRRRDNPPPPAATPPTTKDDPPSFTGASSSASSGVQRTEVLPISQTAPITATPEQPPSNTRFLRRLLLGLSLFALVLAGAVVGSWLALSPRENRAESSDRSAGPPPTDTTDPHRTRPPEDTSPVPNTPVSDSTEAPPAAEDDAPDEAPAAPGGTTSTPDVEPTEETPHEPAHLQVVVIPFGTVRLDGRPITVRRTHTVEPGEHRIVVTSGGRQRTRTIRLAPGQSHREIIRF